MIYLCILAMINDYNIIDIIYSLCLCSMHLCIFRHNFVKYNIVIGCVISNNSWNVEIIILKLQPVFVTIYYFNLLLLLHTYTYVIRYHYYTLWCLRQNNKNNTII